MKTHDTLHFARTALALPMPAPQSRVGRAVAQAKAEMQRRQFATPQRATAGR